MRTRFLLILATAAFAAGAGYLTHGLFFAGGSEGASSSGAAALNGEPLVGRRRPDYTLGSVNGSRVSASDFDGRVVLVNFWATWCAPCREEMPMLMQLRERYLEQGFEVVGIAMDDVQRARDFVSELGIEYPNLVGATDVMAVIQIYGNTSGALPYSVLVDRDGTVTWTKHGVLERAELEEEIEPLLDDS